LRLTDARDFGWVSMRAANRTAKPCQYRPPDAQRKAGRGQRKRRVCFLGSKQKRSAGKLTAEAEIALKAPLLADLELALHAVKLVCRA
jgi:hypothetical protein